jgi:hypothetical protein
MSLLHFWTPAFAGVTALMAFYEFIIFGYANSPGKCRHERDVDYAFFELIGDGWYLFRTT